jgi:hypothetical protein
VAIASIFSLVLWLPVAGVLLQQVGTVGQRFWIPKPTLDFVRSVVLESTVGQVPPPGQIQLSDPIQIQSIQDVALGLIALPRAEPLRQVSLLINRWQEQLYPGLLVLLAFGVYAAWRRAGPNGAFLLGGGAFLPPITLAVVSLAKPLLIARAVIASASLALVLAAVACMALPRVLRPFVAGFVVIWQLLALGQNWWYSGSEAWEATAAQLTAQHRPGDLVLITSRWTQLPLDYYRERYLLAEAGGGSSEAQLFPVQGLPVGYAEQGKPEPVMTDTDVPRLLTITAGRDRVWLVLSHDDDSDPDKVTRRTLEIVFKCFDVQSRPGVTLILFERCAR